MGITTAFNQQYKQWPDDPICLHVSDLQIYPTWIRFHTLPKSKRWPESAKEMTIVLDRHHKLLRSLNEDDMPLWVVICVYSERDYNSAVQQLHKLFQLDLEYWQSYPPSIDNDDNTYQHMYVAQLEEGDPILDAILSKVADDQIDDVLIAPNGIGWLYRPYDGGVDIVCPTLESRNQLKEQYRSWLPRNSFGL